VQNEVKTLSKNVGSKRQILVLKRTLLPKYEQL